MYEFSPLKLEHQMAHGLISAALAIAVDVCSEQAYAMFAIVKTSDPTFIAWREYAGRACTLDVAQRMTLDDAWALSESLPDIIPVSDVVPAAKSKKRRPTSAHPA